MRGKTSQQLSFTEGFLDPSLYELNQKFGDALIEELNKKLVNHLIKTK